MKADVERLKRAQQAMKDAEMDALVCHLPENVLLLSGHWPLIGWSFLLFPQDGKPLLVVPHCDEREAREELWEANCVSFPFGVLVAGNPYADIAAALKQATAKRKWNRVGYEAGFACVAPPWNAAEPAIHPATHAILSDVFGADRLVDATGLLDTLRARKTPMEQDKLRTVNEISAVGLRVFREKLAIGVSGLELAAQVELAIATRGPGHRGARRVRAFAQVSTGPAETSLAYRPMVITSPRPLCPGDLALLELGVVADGFWADRTRVGVAGKPTDRQRTAFEAVRRAQEAAIAAVRPGVKADTVDRAARDVIHAAGFTNAEFLHVTGHGLGLRYHEPTPLICPGGTTVLEEGMVHSVEPGIYVNGFGGIRIEDDILVTATGCEVLGPAEKSLTPEANT